MICYHFRQCCKGKTTTSTSAGSWESDWDVGDESVESGVERGQSEPGAACLRRRARVERWEATSRRDGVYVVPDVPVIETNGKLNRLQHRRAINELAVDCLCERVKRRGCAMDRRSEGLGAWT